MLVRALERTGGPEEEGVRMFKDELRESVLLKDSNRCAERARQALYQVVEAEYEALGGNNNEPLENADEGEAEEGSSSILQNLRKRICRDRERHVEVMIGILLTLEITYNSLRMPMLLLDQLLKPT